MRKKKSLALDAIFLMEIFKFKLINRSTNKSKSSFYTQNCGKTAALHKENLHQALHLRLTLPSQKLIYLQPASKHRQGGHLQPRRRVKALHDFAVVEEAVGAVANGHHAAAAAVDVDAVHVPEGQPDVRGGLGQDGEALVGSVGALGQPQHGHGWEFVDGV